MKRFLSWLGVSDRPDFERARWVGGALGFALLLCGLLISAVAVVAVVRLAGAMFELDGGAPDGALVRNLGLLVVALFGAPFLVWRTMVAQRQADTADAALFNDKIRDAAAGLAARKQVSREHDSGSFDVWEDDVVVRVAAIDALEGLTVERPDETRRVERLLASYVRGTFPARTLEPTEGWKECKLPRLDLQAAVSAIGRLHAVLVERGEVDYRLDLRRCDFDGVDFTKANFFAVDFSESRLEGAVFAYGDFEGCRLSDCLLNHVFTFKANFVGTKFDRAVYSQPVAEKSGMNTFILANSVRGATFAGADISAIDHLVEAAPDQLTFGTADTVLHPDLEELRPLQDVQNMALWARQRAKNGGVLTTEQRQATNQTKNSPFKYWTTQRSDSLYSGIAVSDFYKALGMNRWPYRNGD